ncbi:sugar ABC transporter permease [Conexibacter stalactiti]|uniref:Xylose transport system permease protein XylH n=1 Tax=Conexibacter stalactiti TaxID=1940611 RepID=A0ABU4HID3_9ACTN|nr:sugar ABC transporter permease [Conexibacter stalactiti]MDW5593080.1 sugar ABC transporter permease [Conexibacter stalactiti]MEC5033721.1 sugar ABC transporter permease [Conexibacter stalactiti]
MRRRDLTEKLSGEWRLLPVLATLALIWLFFATQSDAFLTARNLSNLSQQIAVTAIIALALVFVLILAEIDLSVAVLSAVCGAVTAKLVVESGMPAVPAIIIGVAVGTGVGAIQGGIVTTFGAPAFIVTLGGSLALQGVLLQVLPADTGIVPLSDTSLAGIANDYLSDVVGYALAAVLAVLVAALRWQGYRSRVREGLPADLGRSVGAPVAAVLVLGVALVAMFNAYQGVPGPIAILAVLLVVFSYVTTQTRWGTHLYAIGGNAEAARRAGIHVSRVTLTAFMLVGALVAVGGIVAASRQLGVSAQSADSTLVLEAVAAAVIGGASLFGGRGSVWAALFGALIIGSIANGLALLNATTQVRLEVEGGILVAAVVIDALIVRGRLRSP